MSTLLWIGIAIAALLVAFFVVYPVTLLLVNGTKSTGVAVEVAAPTRLTTGQPFDIELRIDNQLDRPRTLRSIDFDNSLLSGVAIDAIEPPPADRSSMLGTTAFYYKNTTLPPHASLTLRLRARSLKPGEFTGSLSVYIDRAHTNSCDTRLRLLIT